MLMKMSSITGMRFLSVIKNIYFHFLNAAKKKGKSKVEDEGTCECVCVQHKSTNDFSLKPHWKFSTIFALLFASQSSVISTATIKNFANVFKFFLLLFCAEFL
ncbi:hypothetical protein ACKWTF_014718 [Chironomus riparius]